MAGTHRHGALLAVAVFLGVMATLTGAYFILQSSSPPLSAAPTVPENRQFDLTLHVMGEGDTARRHWMPPVVVVHEGDTVTLRVTNGDTEASHGFTLGGYNITIPAIPPGRTVTVRFRATRAGIYAYGCLLTGCAPDHAGQTGQLVVLAPSGR